MKLIVGLGNPGKQYEKTRHNIGFLILDNYLNETSLSLDKKNGFDSEYYKSNNIFFQKPTTYMNNSGQAVSKLMNYYKISAEDVYIIYDDMDIEFSKIKIRNNGSSAGHNGIKSIIQHCGNNFNRIRIGIGKKKDEAISHVLGTFTKEEIEILNSKQKIMKELIDDILNGDDIEKLKNKYNNK